ncbi:hypothetical protein [Planctomicrobium sp. SH664]|uniref:hypothetical protein n=1 Tax=Planctomicrobium sp. SH664 TaxID=3448125 RepID=UPI003F5BBAB3
MSTSDPQEVERICYRMQRIRGYLDNDVEGLIAHAQQLTDWRYYLKRYPWAIVSAATALGFLLIPRRQSLKKIVLDTGAAKELAAINEKLGSGASQAKPGLLQSLVMMAATTFLRSGVVYLGEQLKQGNLNLNLLKGLRRVPPRRPAPEIDSVDRTP